MAKAILLIRVSTPTQSFEQQTKELIDVAIRDGYDKKDLIIIENKESAIKNDEEHRLGLIEMKETIENDSSIDCVYVREVSRIGRRYDVLSSIKNYFVTNKIQLIVAGDSRIELLNKDREITLNGAIMFEVACSVAQTEMSEKKIRFAQGKRKAVGEGKCVTNKVLFGYRVNEKTKKIEIDDEKYGNTSSVIEFIFDAYTTTSKSTKAIYQELSRVGRFGTFSRDDIGANQIRRIIMNRAYSGGVNDNGDKTPKVFNYAYPPIVSVETQNKAIEKCINAKKLPKYEHKHVYYAKSILKCVCGHIMIGDSYRNAYKCPYCKKHIGLNAIDYIAWTSAVVLKTEADLQDRKATKEKYETEIKNNSIAIKELELKLENLDETDEKNIKRCSRMQNQDRADKLLDELFAETEKERRKVNDELLHRKETSRQMEQYLKNSSINIDSTATGAVAHIEEESMRRNIILEVISSIVLENIDDLHIKVSVIPNLSIASSYPFHYVYDKSKRPYIKLLHYNGGIFDKDVTSLIFDRFHKPLSAKERLAKEDKIKKIGGRLSVAEISEKFGYSYTSVYNFVRTGVLKGEMINRKIYISLEDAQRFFSSSQHKNNNDTLDKIMEEPTE